jgi:hypothetical protein
VYVADVEAMSMDFSYDLQPRQIVCLEHQTTRLYAEVIQVVKSRQIGWFRPLLLAEFPTGEQALAEPLLYDVRPSADLLWSLTLFRPALDTEVMPLWVQLLASEPPLDRDPAVFAQLHQFMHQVWQDQRDRG